MPLQLNPWLPGLGEWGYPVTPSPKAPSLSTATVVALLGHPHIGKMLSRSISVFSSSTGMNALLRDGTPLTDMPQPNSPAYQTFFFAGLFNKKPKTGFGGINTLYIVYVNIYDTIYCAFMVLVQFPLFLSIPSELGLISSILEAKCPNRLPIPVSSPARGNA